MEESANSLLVWEKRFSAGGDLGVDEVHEFRVFMKRLRAFTFLIAEGKEVVWFQKQLKSLMRGVAGRRDADVMMSLLGGLGVDANSDFGRWWSTCVEDWWGCREVRVKSLVKTLRAVRKRWENRSLRKEDIRKRLKQSQQEVRRRGASALKTGTPRKWHRLRREVKYLFYQKEAVSTAGGAKLRKLGKVLGELNDCDNMRMMMRELAPPRQRLGAWRQLSLACLEREQKLMKRARKLTGELLHFLR